MTNNYDSLVGFREMFDIMTENYTPVNVINMIEYVKESMNAGEVLAVSKYLMVEPTKGASYLKEFYEGHSIPAEKISDEIAMFETYLNKAVDGGYSNYGHIETLNECVRILKTQQAIKETDEYLVDSTLSFLEGNLKRLENRLLESGIQAEDSLQLLENKFSYFFAKVALADDNDIDTITESANELFKVIAQYGDSYDSEIVTEGKMTKKVRSVALKGEKAARNVAMGARKARDDANGIRVIAQKGVGHLTRLIDQTYNKIKDLDKEAQRRAIIENGIWRKVIKLTRMWIIGGAVAVLTNPLFGLLTIVSIHARSKKTDLKLRRELVRDLETELDIVKEKIRDADSRGDRQVKYSLMRLEKKLETEIGRIHFDSKKVAKMDSRDYKATQSV